MATPQEIQQLLKELQQAYDKLGTDNPFAGFDTSNLENAQATAEQLEVALEGVYERIESSKSSFKDLNETLKNIAKELNPNVFNAAKEIEGGFKKIVKEAQKLYYEEEGINKLSLKQLTSLKEKITQQQRETKISSERLLKEQGFGEENLKNIKYITRQSDLYKSLNKEGKVAFEYLKDSNSVVDTILDKTNQRISQERNINKLLGISGQLLSGFEKTLNKIGLGGLSSAFGLDEVNKKMRETAERIEKLGKEIPGMKGKFMVLKSGFKELGAQFKESLNDPATRFTIAGIAAKSAWSSLTFIFNQLKEAAFKVDSELVQFEKSLMLSRNEAIGLRKELTSAASDSIIPTSDLVKALGEVNSLLEIQGKINADNLLIQSQLTRLVGLEGKEAAKLQFFSEALGTNFEDQYESQLGITQQVSKQFGVQVNQKSVLADVGKASAYTLVQFKGSVTALTQAVAESKALGLSLETVGQIAQSILSFESSITAELEAEALLGRDINLDRARYYALTNDISGLMGEINSQIGTFSDFQNLTVIQQQAFAKALGMGVGEMSEMLLKQEYIDKNGNIIKETTNEELRSRLESISAQEKFNLAMEKLQSIVGDLMAGPMGSLLEGMGKLAENATLVKTIFGVIAAFSFAKTIGSLITMGVQLAIASGFAISTASALTLGIGTIAIAAMIAGLTAYAMSGVDEAQAKAQSVGDLISPAKGKTIISTKEGGLFEPSVNDDVMVAPGLASYLEKIKEFFGKDSKNDNITPSTGLASYDEGIYKAIDDVSRKVDSRTDKLMDSKNNNITLSTDLASYMDSKNNNITPSSDLASYMDSKNNNITPSLDLASYMDSKSNTITPSTGLASPPTSPTISDSKIDSLINEIKNMNKRPIEVVSTITMDGRVIAEQIGRNNNDTLGQSLNVSAYNI